MMIDKTYDNAKLTKLVNRALATEPKVQRARIAPNLLHFTMFNEYHMPVPAGKVMAIRTYVTLQEGLTDKEKKGLELDFRFREAGQLTTKTIAIAEGFNTQNLKVAMSADTMRFTFDTGKIKSISITITFVPAERIED